MEPDKVTGEAPGVPADPPAAGTLCAAVPVADLWAEPAPEAERVSQVLLNAPLTRLEEQADFLYVESPDRYRGWIRVCETALAPQGEGEVSVVGELRAPLYADADAPEPCGEAFLGTRVLAGAPAGGRRRVILPAGPAWVPETCLRRPADPGRPLDVPEMLADARRFLGVPYLWGGGSGRGADCSGFVQAVMRLQGRELLRDANLQTRHGEPVEVDALAPGDLVFFGRSERGMPTHVGFYLGSGEYIHAHGRPAMCVEVSILAEALAAGTYWGARRIG